MAPTRCTSCGLTRQNCQCPPLDITPSCWCGWYACLTTILFLVTFFVSGKLFHHKDVCYLDLFANSVSISNANVSTADWRVGLVSKSPLTRCKFKLHMIKSRLLRGDEVISVGDPSVDAFGELVTFDAEADKPVISVDFKNVVTPPGVIGGVVWDYKVEFVVGMKVSSEKGFLKVVCGDIPVIFEADPVGNVVGSLLGNMRRCDYLLEKKLNHSV